MATSFQSNQQASLYSLSTSAISKPCSTNAETRQKQLHLLALTSVACSRAHELEGYLFGTKVCPSQYEDHNLRGEDPGEVRQVNPSFVVWKKTDQSLMSWLLNSISEAMFGHVVVSHEVRSTFEKLFTTQSKACTLQLRF